MICAKSLASSASEVTWTISPNSGSAVDSIITLGDAGSYTAVATKPGYGSTTPLTITVKPQVLRMIIDHSVVNPGDVVHVTIDASKCDKQKLASYSLVYDVLNNLPAKIGMTKMTLPYVCKWLDKFSDGTEGMSGFVMIAESHISIHTFPDQDYVFMDIFSCRSFDTEKAIKFLVKAFDAKNVDTNVQKRGLSFPPKIQKTQNIVLTH